VPPQSSTNFHTQRIVSTSRASARFLRKKNNLQSELIDDFSEFESINPLLKDVLLPAIPAAKISDAVLNDFLAQLNQLPKETLVFSSAENFSQAFDYWISQLAKLTII
jgi:hypothetical protein